MDLIAIRVPSSQESAEHAGGRRTARRANIWRESPNSKDGVEWFGGLPVARRDPSNREGAEKLGGGRGCMAGSTAARKRGGR